MIVKNQSRHSSILIPFAASFDLDKLDRDIERALFSTLSILDQTFNT